MSWAATGVALSAGNLGLGIYGATKKSKKSRPVLPGLSAYGRKAQDQAYQGITQAFSGMGATPGVTSRYKFDMQNALTKGYQEVMGGLSGELDRQVSAKDTKVRRTMMAKIDQYYRRRLRNIDEMDIVQNFQDKQQAIGTGMSAIAQERRMATAVGGIDYQSQLRQMQSPTYQTQFAQGLGGAAGYFAAKMGGLV